jgi:hypothetical protein
MFGDELGLEGPRLIAGDRDRHDPHVGEHRLGRAAVAMIAAPPADGRWGLGFLSQVVSELGAQGPLG